MLPDGVRKEDLDKMWRGNWSESLDTLGKCGFIEFEPSGRVVLKPFMITFGMASIDQSSKKAYNILICEFYSAKMKEAFRMIGRESTKCDSFFERETRNIYQCLHTMLYDLQ